MLADEQTLVRGEGSGDFRSLLLPPSFSAVIVEAARRLVRVF